MPIYMCTNCCNLYDVTNYINFEVTMGLDLSKLRGENRRLKSPAGGGNFLDNFVRMPEGEYGVVTVRLLPTPGAVHDLYCVTRTHKINDKNLHCPMELTENNSGGFSWTGMCPICKHYSGLWKQSDSMAPDDAAQVQALARSIKPLERYYYNCVVRKVTKPDGSTETNVGPKILSVGKQLHARIIRAIVGAPEVDEPELGDVTAFLTGRDLKIIKRQTKSGNNSFPSYNESKFNDVSPAGSKADWDRWTNSLHDIIGLRTLKPLEELDTEVKVFKGEIVREEGASQSFATQPQARTSVTVPAGVPTSKPVAATRKAAPAPTPAPADDIDTSLADDDFLSKLSSVADMD